MLLFRTRREPYFKRNFEFRKSYVGRHVCIVIASVRMDSVENFFAMVGQINHHGVVILETFAKLFHHAVII